jgi:hypothetical protein
MQPDFLELQRKIADIASRENYESCSRLSVVDICGHLHVDFSGSPL